MAEDNGDVKLGRVGLPGWAELAVRLMRDVGFPIVVAAFLLFRLDTTIAHFTTALDQLKDAVVEQRQIMERMLDRLGRDRSLLALPDERHVEAGRIP